MFLTHFPAESNVAVPSPLFQVGFPLNGAGTWSPLAMDPRLACARGQVAGEASAPELRGQLQPALGAAGRSRDLGLGGELQSTSARS